MNRFLYCFAHFVILNSILLTAVSTDDIPKWHEDAEGMKGLAEHWARQHDRLPDGRPAAAERRQAFGALQQMLGARKQRLVSGSRSFTEQLAAAVSSSTWTPVPAQSAFAGRMTSIAIDPRNDNVVYAGAADGGVWKTTDGGVNWSPLTDNQNSLAIGALAIDPAAPDTIYAGTGEGGIYPDARSGIGLLKSADGGATWSVISAPFTENPNFEQPVVAIDSIAINPITGTILICASNGDNPPATTAIYRSTDHGATWTTTLNEHGIPIPKVSFSPDGSAAYAVVGLGGFTSSATGPLGIYKSTDDGASWIQILPLGVNNINSTNVQIAVAPSAPQTIYIGLRQYDGYNPNDAPVVYSYSLMRSLDAGATWQTTSIPNWCGSACDWTGVISVSPIDANVLFLGGLSLFRSMDGGKTWAAEAVPHPDLHAMALSPSGKAYLAGDGGVFTMANANAATLNWTSVSQTLSTLQFYTLDVHPTNPNFMIGGTQDNGTELYDGSVSSSGSKPQWQWELCGDGEAVAIDPVNPLNIYANCSGSQFWVSRDGGRSWTSYTHQWGIILGSAVFAALSIDPNQPNTLYSGFSQLMRSTDAGVTWTAITSVVVPGAVGVISVAPHDSKTVYAAWTTGFDGNGIRVTHDANDPSPTWTVQTQGLPLRGATQIAVDPQDPGTAYITFGSFYQSNIQQDIPGHVFVAHNSLASITDITANLPNIPVNDIVVDPDQPGTLYLATDIGVFISVDGGNLWSPMITGLPRSAVTALKLQRSSRILFAATHGRSVWELQLPAAQVLFPTITPQSLSFAAQPVGSTSAAQSLAIINQTSGAVTVSQISVTGDFAETDNCTRTLAVGGNCAVSVTFLPTAAGNRAGMLTLTSSAGQQAVALAGTGLASAAPFVTPASLNFSSAPIGTTTAAQVLTLLNPGTAAVSISSVQVSKGFSETNNCGTQLAAKSSCQIQTVFAPTTLGNITGQLTVSTAGLTLAANLFGTGIPAATPDFSISANPSSTTVNGGHPTNVNITITPVNGFSAPATLACSSPSLPASTSLSCTFTPNPIAVNGVTSVALSISVAQTGSSQVAWGLAVTIAPFGLVFLAAGKRKRLATLSVLILCAAVVAVNVSCRGLQFSQVSPIPSVATSNPAGPASSGNAGVPNTVTISVAVTSGSLQHSVPLNITVQ